MESRGCYDHESLSAVPIPLLMNPAVMIFGGRLTKESPSFVIHRYKPSERHLLAKHFSICYVLAMLTIRCTQSACNAFQIRLTPG